MVTNRPETPAGQWKRYTAATDTLRLADATGDAASYAAAVRVIADGHRKAYLWVGLKGRMAARLNGQQVMQAEGLTRYRVGQFRQSVDLNPGENLLEFRVEPAAAAPQLSALLVGPGNDGDTVDGVRWAV
jgi:hypothetical protein